jgi:hypothetical protein
MTACGGTVNGVLWTTMYEYRGRRRTHRDDSRDTKCCPLETAKELAQHDLVVYGEATWKWQITKEAPQLTQLLSLTSRFFINVWWNEEKAIWCFGLSRMMYAVEYGNVVTILISPSNYCICQFFLLLFLDAMWKCQETLEIQFNIY